MSEAQRYSSGHVAVVHTLSDQERGLFTHADLARVDKIADLSWFARLYYKHKVASLLYPDNFIDVVGAHAVLPPPLVPTQTRSSRDIQNHSLYSHRASVSPDHATYSDHARLIVGTDKVYKESTCSCPNCASHRQEHKDGDMLRLAQETSDIISSSGIVAPADDPSDYCLTPKGIVFFEFKLSEPLKLKRSLAELENPTLAERMALHSLQRYLALDMAVRLEAMRGKSIGMRITS